MQEINNETHVLSLVMEWNALCNDHVEQWELDKKESPIIGRTC